MGLAVSSTLKALLEAPQEKAVQVNEQEASVFVSTYTHITGSSLRFFNSKLCPVYLGYSGFTAGGIIVVSVLMLQTKMRFVFLEGIM